MARNRNHGIFDRWAELPDDLLRILLLRLGFFDFFALASVCTSWRNLARAEKQNFFLSKHQPFVIIISLYAKRACSFLNIIDRTRYRTLLPNLTARSVLGLSGGYILMQDIVQTWAINPLTKTEITFPSLWKCFSTFGLPRFRSVLVYSPQISDYLMIAVSRGDKHFIMARPGRTDWLIFDLPPLCFSVSDITFFQGKIYILSISSEIFQLSLFPYIDITQVRVKKYPFLVSVSLQLVASDDRLLIVDLRVGYPLGILEVDFTKKELVKISNLGDEALFYSEIKSCLAKPGKWGGASNSVYLLNSQCRCFTLDGSLISVTNILEPDAVRCHPYLWYIPPYSCNQHTLEQ